MSDAQRVRHRFAVPPQAVSVAEVRFPPTVARQMRRVLRLSRGDRVVAFDGRGGEYVVRLVALRDEIAIGEIESNTPARTEPRIELTLYQALLPREKFELVLQKATEIGVRAFVPLITERSLVPASALNGGRLERWRRIIQESAEQSGRAALPHLHEPLSLTAALTQLGSSPALFAWEQESRSSLRQALQLLRPRFEDGRLALFVGPEGGFSAVEAAAAKAAGATLVSLGPRVFRSETAGPVLAALSLYESGDLEPVT